MAISVEDLAIRRRFGEGYSKLKDFNASLFSIGGFEQFVNSMSSELKILQSKRINDELEDSKIVALKYRDLVLTLSLIIPTVFEQIWEEKIEKKWAQETK